MQFLDKEENTAVHRPEKLSRRGEWNGRRRKLLSFFFPVKYSVLGNGGTDG